MACGPRWPLALCQVGRRNHTKRRQLGHTPARLYDGAESLLDALHQLLAASARRRR